MSVTSPDRAWILDLYCDLVGRIELLHERHALGAASPLRPLRALVREVCEALPENSALLELLPKVRDARRPWRPAERRVAVLVTALRLGRSVGLGRRDRLALGLAAALSGLPDTSGGGAVLASLLRYGDIGELGPLVVDTVHSAASVASPPPEALAPRVLIVAEAYVELLAGSDQREALAPAHALAALDRGRVPRVDPGLVRRLGLIKGAWPVGSILRLSNGRLSLVVGWSDNQSHGRPRVLPLGDEGIRRPLDLACLPGLHIVETLSAASVDLDLSILRSSPTRGVERDPWRHDVRGEGWASLAPTRRLLPEASDEDSVDFDLSIDASCTLDPMTATTADHPPVASSA